MKACWHSEQQAGKSFSPAVAPCSRGWKGAVVRGRQHQSPRREPGRLPSPSCGVRFSAVTLFRVLICPLGCAHGDRLLSNSTGDQITSSFSTNCISFPGWEQTHPPMMYVIQLQQEPAYQRMISLQHIIQREIWHVYQIAPAM